MHSSTENPRPAPTLSELGAAGINWVNDALVLNPASTTRISYFEHDAWTALNDESFVRNNVLQSRWNFDFLEKARQLPSYSVLSELLSAQPDIAQQLGRQVGTGYGSAGMDLRRITDSFMPDSGQADIDQDELAVRIESQIASLFSETLQVNIMVPVLGLKLESGPIRLSPELVLDQATPAETAECLNLGMLKLIFANIGNHQVVKSEMLVLRVELKIPKEIIPEGGSLSEGVRAKIRYYQGPVAEEFAQCVALFTSSPVDFLGFRVKCGEDTPYQLGTMFSVQPTKRYAYASFDLDLDGRKEKLVQFWNRTHDETTRPNRAHALALRRLSFATQRERQEDRLLDLMIAAEALYLTDIGNEQSRGELSYRLCHRAAVYAVPYSMTGRSAGAKRRRVFDVMKAGYEARSAVAHGADVARLKLKITGTHKTLDEIVLEVEDVLRIALNEAIQLSTPVDWKDLVMPPGR